MQNHIILDIISKRKIDSRLTSILYLSLQSCSTVTMVKTSIYDVNTKCAAQGGTPILGGRGALDLTSTLEAKFGARSSQVHQIRGKTWEVL